MSNRIPQPKSQPEDRYAIDDEVLEALLKPEARVRIEGVFYQVSRNSVILNDVVLDRNDGLYGTVTMIKDDAAAVSCGGVSELNVPLSRLLKLTKIQVN